MPNKTSIEWTDFTSNPIRALDTDTGKRGWACAHVSPGCEHCYAETLNRRFGTGLRFTAPNLGRVRFELNEKEIASWRRLPAGARVFICDMLDLFLAEIPDAMIDAVFAGFALAPKVTFQVLTKRADRMRAYLIGGSTPTGIVKEANRLTDAHIRPLERWLYHSIEEFGWPLPNVWAGASCEDQRRADERVPLLLQCPAAVRFVSAEPLLGAVDLSRWLRIAWQCGGCQQYFPDPLQEVCPNCGRVGYWTGSHEFNPPGRQRGSGLDWVIVGGESGPGARPCETAWVRSLSLQCRKAGVPCFTKQLGTRPAVLGRLARLRDRKGGDPAEWPGDLRIRQFPVGRAAA